MSTTSIAQVNDAPPQPQSALQPVEGGLPLTAVQLKARLNTIQSVMREVMQQGVDFGNVPGTDKPTLFKPGAEKLCVTFRLAADDPHIESVPDPGGDIRYRVRVPVRAANGAIVAVGVGECSTGEEKYRWRRPVHPKEYENAPEDQKRVKYTRNGDAWQQVRVTPADVANTVLKMAHKRAYVHAVIMATAAGSIFTQDVEDLPEGTYVEDEAPAARPSPPQRRPEPQPQAQASGHGGPVISEPQAKRLFAIAMQAGWSTEELGAWLRDEYNIASDRDIPRRLYDQIVQRVQAGAGA